MIFKDYLCCFGCNRNPVNDSKRLLANQSTSNANKKYGVHTLSKISGNYKAALLAKRPNLTGSATNLAGSITNLTGSKINLTESRTSLTGSKINLTESRTNLTGSKINLTGSRTNLTESKINLTGSRTNLTESKINLTGSRTNLTESKINLTENRINLTGSRINLTGSSTNLIGCQTNILLSGRQCILPNLQNEMDSDLEKSIAQTHQASQIVEKQDRWGNAFLKMRRESLRNSDSFYTVAKFSMMMPPTITVGGSSSSKIGSSENTINPGSNTLSKCGRGVKSLTSSPKTSTGWLKSQSMLDVTCTSHTEPNQISKSTDDIARNYDLNTSLYGNTHVSKSMEAVNQVWKSMDNLVNEKIFIDLPSGAVHFIPSYSSDTKKLIIQIEKIEGLAPKGVNRLKYDCVIKLTMLPNEKHFKFSKTIPAHGTLDQEECFIFNVKDPVDKVLRISVYDTKFLGKYDAVGHALFYIVDALTHEQKSHVLKLYRQSLPDIEAGSIKIVLNYKKQTELLNVFIDEAYNLPIISGKCRSYLKLTLYNFGKKVKEIHSSSINITKQLRYKFAANLNIDSRALQNSSIVISVKMRTLFKDILIGRVILGPYFYTEHGKILTPWGRALIKQETVSHVFRLYQ